MPGCPPTNCTTAPGGLAFTLREGGEQLLIETGLIGNYNVANLLAVIAACARWLTTRWPPLPP